MKKCAVYDPETLGLYVDGELEPHARKAVERHLDMCIRCRSVVENYEQLAATFKQGIERRAPWEVQGLSEKRVPPVNTRLSSFWTGMVDFVKAKKYTLQLASIAAILFAGVFYYQDRPVLQDGPSAIINFVEGDMASVMIFETHPSNHTIIWYTEG
jgi:anti-sigma factor RsiW